MNGPTTTALAAPYPKPAVAWYGVSMLMIAYIISFIDRIIFGLLVGPIRKEFAINDTVFSLLYGWGFAFFYTFFGIFIGWAADRYSRRNLVVWGVGLWSLMTAACGIAQSFWQLALARIGVGVGEASLSPATYSMAGDSFPEKQLGRALSVYVIGLPVGVGLALIIGGQVIGYVVTNPYFTLPLIGAVKSWQACFLLVGLPGVLFAFWLLTIKEPVRRKATPVSGKSAFGEILDTLRYMLGHWRAYAGLVLGFSVLGMIMNVFQIWGVQYFVRLHGYSLPDASLNVGLVIGVFGTIGILTGGWLADRMRSAGRLDATMRVGLLAAAVMIPFAATATLMPDPRVGLLLMLPIGFFTSFAFGAGGAAVVVLTPSHMRAQASAVYLFFVNMIGIGLAPFLTAWFTDHVFGSDLAVGKSAAIVAGGAAIGATLLFIWGLPHYRRQVAAQEHS
ncbi:MAG TPA: MFS transporter [Steroidobacteraceae bacterium]|nr:MFS transporter [Steroidobacteraceae bacterium]HRX88226.1 MFS transporter [Steroidobacteraceae bacterium]